jgi:DNA-binding response OmpR family regulator
MKQVLIIGENPPFCEYLKMKLGENSVNAEVAIKTLDGVAKIRSVLPDLIILDYDLSRQGCFEILLAKKNNPNTVSVPIIVIAQQVDQETIVELSPYNVKKVFTKPINIDTLFEALSGILNIPFKNTDDSPGIVEVHVNENILFIELAKGLNRDKLDLLMFKIMELVDLNSIKVPKLILMISDMVLSFADAPNLQKLLDVVLSASRAKLQNIRVLTLDDFIREFIEGRKEYDGIEVVSNLQYAVDGLLAVPASGDQAELIGDRLLSGGGGAEGETMQLRYDAEDRPKKMDRETLKRYLSGLKIAAVDDDLTILDMVRLSFQHAGGNIMTYPSGEEFLAAVARERFDLIFLDLLMPGMDGFALLNIMNEKNFQIPVIVLSAVSERETVLRAFRQGVKSYVTKPFYPEALFTKIIEILRPEL